MSESNDDLRQRSTLFEYVSANPNAPITIHHGRGGVIGDVLANLRKAGSGDDAIPRVQREFYVNDNPKSSSMRLFSRAVYAQYRRLLGKKTTTLPSDDSEGEITQTVAQQILQQIGEQYSADTLFESINASLPLDFQSLVVETMRRVQEQSLSSLGVQFDSWFLESTLHTEDKDASGSMTERVIADLTAKGHTYEQNGALWLRSSRLGDTHDHTLVRADGSMTYLASDLAYHRDKFTRGFDTLVDIWDADHAGYVRRTRAGLDALGLDTDRLHIILYGKTHLLEEGTERVSGKQENDPLTLNDFLAEVGTDRARFFYLSRSPGSNLELEISQMKAQNITNPFYQVQEGSRLSHALLSRTRIESLPESNLDVSVKVTPDLLVRLVERFTDEKRMAAEFAPHRLPLYLLDVAESLRLLGTTAQTLPQPLLERTVQIFEETFGLLGIAPIASPDRGELERP